MVRAVSVWRALSTTIWIVFICAAYAVFFVPATQAQTPTSTIIYESDFSTDPQWVTDQPENFYWSATHGALFARTMNTPATTSIPTRHYYSETSLNPRLSYELTYDLMLTYAGGPNGGSGSMPFGLYGERLDSFNRLNLWFSGNTQDGTFGTRFLQLDGVPAVVYTEANPGYNKHHGVENPVRFARNMWYSVSLRYEAPAHAYHFSVRERDSGESVLVRTIYASSSYPINPELRRLGISMHPEGIGLTNLSYGDRGSGYAEFFVDNVRLVQYVDDTLDAPPSIFFIPGIQASRLYTEGLVGDNQLWEPNRNADVEKLAMSEDGVSIEDVYTRDTLGSAYGLIDIYDSLFTHFETLKKSGDISAWESFPYDWRYNVADIVQKGTRIDAGIKSPVEALVELSRNNNSKIIIIAHSNGGLVAKELIDALRAIHKEHLIDRLVFLAVPHLGTPKAIGSLLHGYDQEILGGLVVSSETAREAMRNMPGAYGLVPTATYLSRAPAPITFSSASSTTLFTSAYGDAVTTASELSAFMRGDEGRPEAETVYEAGRVNADLFLRAQEHHNTLLDVWRAPPGIEVFDVVGVGLDTVRGFRYDEQTTSGCTMLGCVTKAYYEPIPLFTAYGDGTVVATSAEAYEGAMARYYVDLKEVDNDEVTRDVSHANIGGLLSVHKLITALIRRTSTAIPFVYTTPRVFGRESDIISVHSPVSVSIRDAGGREVRREGSGTQARIVADIPGASYHEFGSSTYVIVPSGLSYTVTLTAYEEGGYGVRIGKKSGEETHILSTLVATTSSGAVMTFGKTGGVWSDLSYDYNGDGIIDHVSALNGRPTTATLYETVRSTVSALSSMKASDRSWILNALDRVERTAVRKGEDSSGVARIVSQIEGRLFSAVTEGVVSPVVYDEIMTLLYEIQAR